MCYNCCQIQSLKGGEVSQSWIYTPTHRTWSTRLLQTKQTLRTCCCQRIIESKLSKILWPAIHTMIVRTFTTHNIITTNSDQWNDTRCYQQDLKVSRVYVRRTRNQITLAGMEFQLPLLSLMDAEVQAPQCEHTRQIWTRPALGCDYCCDWLLTYCPRSASYWWGDPYSTFSLTDIDLLSVVSAVGVSRMVTKFFSMASAGDVLFAMVFVCAVIEYFLDFD